MKKYWLSVVVVLIVSVALNYVVHCILMAQAYLDTASLWRAADAMNVWLFHAPTLIGVLCFVYIYDHFIGNKNVKNAFYYGCLWGIAAGSAVGITTYAVMPIAVTMGCFWFFGAFIQWAIAGAILGWIYNLHRSHN